MKKHFTMAALIAATALSAQAKYTIPVVVHVISNDGQAKIKSIDQIKLGIKRLNEHYNGTYSQSKLDQIYSGHKALIGSSKIEFVLAGKKPDGTSTDGIDFVYSTANSNMGAAGSASEQEMRTAYQWDPTKYLNIYILNKHWENSGSAYLPNMIGSDRYKDGLLILKNMWPDSASGVVSWPGYSDGGYEGVFPHEIGHYLGLVHTHGNQNDSFDACDTAGADDGVADTPRTNLNSNRIDFGTAPGNSCEAGKTINVDNYMSYSRRQSMFTHGQIEKMHEVLDSDVASRNNLHTIKNLVDTGVYKVGSGKVETGTRGYIKNMSINSTSNNNFTDINGTNKSYLNSDDRILIGKSGTYTLTLNLNSYYNKTTRPTDPGYTYVAAWIDWNGNRVFDANEFVRSNAVTGTNNIRLSLKPPVNASTAAPVLMHVKAVYDRRLNPSDAATVFFKDRLTGNSVNTMVKINDNFCSPTPNLGGVEKELIREVGFTAADTQKHLNRNPYNDFTKTTFQVSSGDNTLNVKLNGFFNATGDRDYVIAMVDWNNDGKFEDVLNGQKEIYISPNLSSDTGEIAINAPVAAQGKTLRMRVRSLFSTDNNLTTYNTPCDTDQDATNYGQANDYLLKVNAPAAARNGQEQTAQEELNQWIAYPNPSHGELSIDSNEDTQVSVFNILGQQVKTIEVKKGKNPIDLSELDKGLYILKSDKQNLKEIKVILN